MAAMKRMDVHVMTIVVLSQLMILRALRVNTEKEFARTDSGQERLTGISPQPETQDVEVVWDGYCGSMKLKSRIGNPTDAGKVCGCGDEENWKMKGRNGYKSRTFPTIGMTPFRESLTQENENWVLKGVLNGWNALSDLQLKSIKCEMAEDHEVSEIWESLSKEDPRVIDWSPCEEARARATLFTKTAKVHAEILPDDYCETNKDPLVCTNTACKLKPMRPTPTVELPTLEKALKPTSHGLVYAPAANGWPAFVNLPAVVNCGNATNVVFEGDSLWTDPANCRPSSVTLQLPSWMAHGWSESAPGFVFWFRPSALRPEGASIAVGTDILQQASETKIAKHVYAFAHRYAPSAWTWKLHEKIRDVLTYHAALFIEWVDEPYTTVIELAWQNGLGGYKGQSNWYDDKNSSRTELFQTMLDQAPPMVRPWIDSRAEIRILDMPLLDHAAFVEYLAKYSKKQKGQRFYDVHGISNEKMAGDVLWDRKSEADIFKALLSYNKNSGGGYSEGGLNCQTFQADLFSWLTGHDTSVFADQLKTPTRLLMKYEKHSDWFE